MNTTTINISLPKGMYQDAKKYMQQKRFASISELIRNALRGMLYPNLTENGFTPEFEDMVLESAKEPIELTKPLDDIDAYFAEMKQRIGKNDKRKKNR